MDTDMQKCLQNYKGDVPKLLDTVFKFVKDETGNAESKKHVTAAIKRNFASFGGKKFATGANPFPPEKQQISERDWNLANVSVKKKSDRQLLLKGFACLDCDDYYKSTNLPENEVQEAIHKCSKHRASIVPPKNSPKGMYNQNSFIRPLSDICQAIVRQS